MLFFYQVKINRVFSFFFSDRRVAAAFPPLAGFAGMAVGISAWCHQQTRYK